MALSIYLLEMQLNSHRLHIKQFADKTWHIVHLLLHTYYINIISKTEFSLGPDFQN